MSKIEVDTSRFAEDVQEVIDKLRSEGVEAAKPMAEAFAKKYAEGATAIKGSECAGCTSCAGCAICGVSAIEAIQAGHLLRAFHLG
ncbi:MAG: hypothetical protein KMY53_04555 [Desulfarculus sp.]|nr:hypothetical protein [Pseudomonadota bacterium]MBV1714914.1 hypothetical protein [Desulfarculus sp.]MBU4573054.1 hypothetical protein [Pseudomonadota bacterium]MBU4599033.1 hypothetical protein [Pseudomonadota bacterium]MBV1737414.1 hypothetical protein [Desulfarculus sp.]